MKDSNIVSLLKAACFLKNDDTYIIYLVVKANVCYLQHQTVDKMVKKSTESSDKQLMH